MIVLLRCCDAVDAKSAEKLHKFKYNRSWRVWELNDSINHRLLKFLN